LTILKLLAN